MKQLYIISLLILFSCSKDLANRDLEMEACINDNFNKRLEFALLLGDTPDDLNIKKISFIDSLLVLEKNMINNSLLKNRDKNSYLELAKKLENEEIKRKYFESRDNFEFIYEFSLMVNNQMYVICEKCPVELSKERKDDKYLLALNRTIYYMMEQGGLKEENMINLVNDTDFKNDTQRSLLSYFFYAYFFDNFEHPTDFPDE